MAWRLAKSLGVLRDQVNAAVPGRDKSSDGTIGDESHSSRSSDHNPNGAGVVCAMDITHDPAGGLDSYKLAESLRQARDHRVKYIISNRRISNPDVQDWAWRPYNGSNPHDHHVHVSVKGSPSLYDNTDQWKFSVEGVPPGTPAPLPTKPKPSRIRRGASGEYVKKLQQKLGLPDDGIFGSKTEQAVVDFQRKNDLVDDGIVGPYTWSKLGISA